MDGSRYSNDSFGLEGPASGICFLLCWLPSQTGWVRLSGGKKKKKISQKSRLVTYQLRSSKERTDLCSKGPKDHVRKGSHWSDWITSVSEPTVYRLGKEYPDWPSPRHVLYWEAGREISSMDTTWTKGRKRLSPRKTRCNSQKRDKRVLGRRNRVPLHEDEVGEGTLGWGKGMSKALGVCKCTVWSGNSGQAMGSRGWQTGHDN